MKRALKIIIMLLLAVMAWPVMGGVPVAMVTDVSGNAKVDGKVVQLLAELPEDSVLELSSGEMLTLIYFSTGEEFSLNGRLKAVVKKDALYVSGKRLQGESVLAATESVNLSPTGLSQAAIVMRAPTAPDNPLKLRYPFGSKILEQDPTLKWEMKEKGYHYRVEILAEDGRSLYVAETNNTELKLPEKIRLPREELLTWEIEAKRGVQRLFAFADFQVASLDIANRVEQQRASLGEDFSRQLLFAKYLERMGLNHEAYIYWKKLSSLRPDDPVLKSKLK